MEAHYVTCKKYTANENLSVTKTKQNELIFWLRVVDYISCKIVLTCHDHSLKYQYLY